VVWTEVATLVSILVAVTLTLGIADPLASSTLPVMLAVLACPKSMGQAATMKTSSEMTILFMAFSSFC
jgi:hypothetical protein